MVCCFAGVEWLTCLNPELAAFQQWLKWALNNPSFYGTYSWDGSWAGVYQVVREGKNCMDYPFPAIKDRVSRGLEIFPPTKKDREGWEREWYLSHSQQFRRGGKRLGSPSLYVVRRVRGNRGEMEPLHLTAKRMWGWGSGAPLLPVTRVQRQIKWSWNPPRNLLI